MKNAKTKAYLTIALIAYVVVLGVNIFNNYGYYRETGDWQYSVTFCLLATTLGCTAAIAIFEFASRRAEKKPMKPALSLLSTLVVSGIFGWLLIVATIKLMDLLFHSADPSMQDYISSGTYSVLFCMIFGLAGWGMEALYQWKRNAEENADARYQALKTQVNPHFFFNSLNTLSTIIPQDAGLAVDFVQQLSKVFRYSLQHEKEQTVSLQAELAIADSYLFLNKQRFGDKLRAQIHVSDKAREQKVVVQSLLMLVENAIKHNEISTSNPLNLSIYDANGMLVIENDKRQKELAESSTGLGLDNIVNRYAMLTNIPVAVSDTNDKFIVKLPLL